MSVEFRVVGIPGPQGSKKAIPLAKNVGGKRVFTGKVSLVESSAKVKPWRAAVESAARGAVRVRLAGPVAVDVTFFLPRPKGHYRTGRYAHLLKDSAPRLPDVKPDIDKLLRSTYDGLTSAGIYSDDSRVTDGAQRKRYATTFNPPGALISIRPADQEGMSGELPSRE